MLGFLFGVVLGAVAHWAYVKYAKPKVEAVVAEVKAGDGL